MDQAHVVHFLMKKGPKDTVQLCALLFFYQQKAATEDVAADWQAKVAKTC